jgi:hypothetical protein
MGFNPQTTTEFGDGRAAMSAPFSSTRVTPILKRQSATMTIVAI